MNKKIVVAGSVLSLAVSAIGISALSGCKSNMTALNSDMPNAVNGSLKGEYVLENVKAKARVSDEAIKIAMKNDAILREMFAANGENQKALPIDVTVEATSADAKGLVALVNNLAALCSLTVWPAVDSVEYDYTVTVASLVGSHKVKFKVLDRSWHGLSPLALIPVPGWSDERGDESRIQQFHATQVAVAVKEACAELPNDYAIFKKNQPKYLELISQSRSETAFATFLTANAANAKVGALSKVVNASIITKHQNDLIAAFKSNSDGSVRAAILPKLNDGSFDNLPYDPILLSYWSKLSNSRLLAMVYRDGYAKLSEADRKNLVAKISDDAVLTEMVTSNGDGLYVKDAKARVTLYQAMKPEMVKKLAGAILAAHKLSDWNRKDISALESVADMSVAVADKNVSAEIAISLACKVDSYWRECKGSWSYRWDDADKKQWATLKKKITPVLTDDILVSKIKADRNLWSALAELISDKSKVSALAHGYVVEARTTKDINKIKDAWACYGFAIVDNSALEEIAVKDPAIREAALAQIKGDAAKKHAQEAVKAELARLAVIRNEKIKKVIPIAEAEANDVMLLFAKTGMNDNQRESFKHMYRGRVLIFRQATVWNNNCDSDNNAHRILMHASYPSKELINSNNSIDFFADFWGNFKKNSRKLEGFKKADVVTIVKEGRSFCFFVNAAVLDGKNDVAIIEAFLNDCEVSDETLDDMLASVNDRTILKLAKEVDLEFTEVPPSAQPRKSVSFGEALKAAGELSQQIDELKAAKKEVGKAWSDLKGEVKKGMSEAISEKDKADLKKSMDDLKSAADALKNLTK